MMTTDANIAETLSRSLPLPRTVSIGDQRWTIAVSAVLTVADDLVSVRLLLSGPYGRFRRARLDLDAAALQANAYDPARVVQAIKAWLPHSDEDDVLGLSGQDLAGAPPGGVARSEAC